MGPLEVTAGVAAVLVAVAAVLAVRAVISARRRTRRDDDERGPDDTAMRPEVLERLHQVTAQWDARSEAGRPSGDAAAGGDAPVPGREDVSWSGPSHADEGPRRRRAGPLTWVLAGLLVVAVVGAATLFWLTRA